MRHLQHPVSGALRSLPPRAVPATVFAAFALLAIGCSDGGGGDADGSASDSTPTAVVSAAQALVSQWVESERIPGAVLLVSSDEGVLATRAYGAARLYDFGRGQYDRHDGIARLETPTPMTPETVFDLASVTKVMATTLSVMVLVDRGRLDVEAPVSRYLPDFTGGGKEAVTLRDLLTHRAGLSQWRPTYYHAGSPDQAYAYIRELPLEWEPGRERHYSDLGFMVLGRVVETVAGTSLDEFVRREIYAPLGLEDTGYRPRDVRDGAEDARSEGDTGTSVAGERTGGPTGRFAATSHGNPFERRMVHDVEFGYRIDGDADSWDGWRAYTVEGEVNDGNAHHAFGGVAGHAGLFSTARELDVLLRLMLNGGEYDGTTLFGGETVDRFLEPTGDAQALGWQLPTWAPEGSFGHTGFTGTFVLGIPDRGLAVVLLTNRLNLGVDSDTQYPDVGPLQRGVALALTAGR